MKIDDKGLFLGVIFFLQSDEQWVVTAAMSSAHSIFKLFVLLSVQKRKFHILHDLQE